MPPVVKLKLEEGMYKEAARKGIGFSQFLEEHYCEKAGEESVYKGKSAIEQAMVKNVLRLAGKEIPLTAFEKQLAAYGIKAFGNQTDFVSKFFSSSDSAVLFPNYVSNRIFAGLLISSLVKEFVATTEVISGTNYQKLYMAEVESDRQLRNIGEGAEFPAVEVKVSDQMVAMKKFGRYLKASYEAIKNQNLNAFGKTLERIGLQIGIDETDEMISTIINGDGNSNTPATTVETAATGTIAVGDVIAWASGAPNPYKMDKFVGKKALLQEYWTTLAGMNNPSDQFGFIGIGLPKAYEWDRTIVTADRFFGVDSRLAIGHFTMGEVMVESEKMIRTQINGTAISQWSGFHIIDNNATLIFDETH